MLPILKHNLNTEVYVAPSYHTKETFGDIDILISDNGFLCDINMFIRGIFGTENIHTNGNVHSFVYDEIQIDLIRISHMYFEFAKTWFAYDPLPNLMGKVAHKFGLKYGFNGLVMPYRGSSGLHVRDIMISRDNRKIFEFLGFDYDAYLRGFETMQDVFDYVANSKYFVPENFLMENLNHIDRKRTTHRPSYQEFLKFINSEVERGRKWDFQFLPEKDMYVPHINIQFPEANLYAEIKNCIDADARVRRIAEKFNGDMVKSAFPELSGEKLGEYIRGFRSHVSMIQRTLGFDGDDNRLFNDYIFNVSDDMIRKEMQTYYERV